ncbi:LOG family protein [Sphingomonas sp. BIUV-7]|uniref:AMP nucleosidase n=1 Tax=Sphingomonas natans TaxID=3063330 RepID=A0ABT8Y3Z7_9SPHN|nr:LOG family protein [Sphingomonas sp. BIUV-7]MDO6413041.1 LOG family protein [Sphingomonas sp. BIUV-7]
MAKKQELPERVFPKAKDDAAAARSAGVLPQTSDPAYRLAYADSEFLMRDDLRPVRFQLELLKPELLLDEAGIGSTFVFYGSARIPAPDKADAIVDAAKTETQQRIAGKLKAKSHYYEVARELAQIASREGGEEDGKHQFVVCSGGGPSIMEAANRGARDVGAETVGLNIALPFEQAPNDYVTPHLSFNFHYFALRKMHFLMRARAVAVFPGGFGTFDEFFELLTLIQTGKMAVIPIILYGKDFWSRVVDFDALVEEGVVAPQDLDLIHYCETAEEGWAYVQDYYQRYTEKRFRKGRGEKH